uniref:C-type lectin domain-containing protein n=1 Tax=Acanthochromis polyacanthus TaxID=80966 RepID=A0A3Q1GS16_9TELE
KLKYVSKQILPKKKKLSGNSNLDSFLLNYQFCEIASVSRFFVFFCTIMHQIILFLSATELRCSGLDWYEFGEFCYKPFEEKKTWHQARDACRKVGADLVSILSLTEQIFLALYSKASSKWIGLKHNPTEGGYSWSDGTPLSHTNWGYGEPNNHEGREECVEMVSSTNGTVSWWNDLNCDAHQDWICMIRLL